MIRTEMEIEIEIKTNNDQGQTNNNMKEMLIMNNIHYKANVTKRINNIHNKTNRILINNNSNSHHKSSHMNLNHQQTISIFITNHKLNMNNNKHGIIMHKCNKRCHIIILIKVINFHNFQNNNLMRDMGKCQHQILGGKVYK